MGGARVTDDTKPDIHVYKGCRIEARLERARNLDGTPGSWIPAAWVTVPLGGSEEVHPLQWREWACDTPKEARARALQLAMRWVDEGR